jgi:uncharacterized membrane protein YfcA
MHLEPWQWALAALCAVLNGMAKTGIPGLGILPVVLMLWVIPDSRLSGGAVLPMLCLADLFAVRWYRHHARWDRIVRLSPWVGAGLVLGCATLWWVPSGDLLDRLMGGLILVMVALQGVRLWRGDPPIPHRWWLAACFGITAGFATTVANAAGPVMSLYLLSMGLGKDQFMGTGAWFFLIINLVKVPLFLIPDQQGQARITADTLLLDLWVAPLVIVGALVGRLVFARLRQQAFAWLVLILAGLGCLKLVLPAARPAEPPSPAAPVHRAPAP